ncbi:MAG: methyltransferase domain-containing protein [Actinomycetota bacterium]
MMMLSEYLSSAYEEAERQNRRVVIELAGQVRTVLDCGCGDGSFTLELARAASGEVVLGLEIDEDAATIAEGRGVEVHRCDLNGRFPLEDDSVDVAFSNQVIEHLYDTDNLMAEGFRVLRPGGVLVVSTENLSAWHNILALVLGWQPFSLTNISESALGLGNPLALHRGEVAKPHAMRHLRIFTPRSLSELAGVHGFVIERLVGAGYFPLSGRIAEFMSRVDRWHAAFITIKARKPV